MRTTLQALTILALSWTEWGHCLAKPITQANISKSPTKAASEAVERKDLPSDFQKLACRADPTGNRPAQAWDAKIFDAQVEGLRVSSRNGLPVDRALVLRKARNLARIKRYQGYAVGNCPDGSAWAAVFPSPVNLQSVSEQRREFLVLPTEALNKSCESWRVDFAPANTARPHPHQIASTKTGRINLSTLGDGTIGVSCQPHAPGWQGPILWFLAPVGQGPGSTIPADVALTGSSTRESLMLWINQLRTKLHLPPLRFTESMNAQADVLAIDGSLAHDRKRLRDAAAHLETQRIKLLGENRVRAADKQTMAWLLWNSPRHRELLLQANAKIAGLAQREFGSETLVVVVLGDETPLVNARAVNNGANPVHNRRSKQ